MKSGSRRKKEANRDKENGHKSTVQRLEVYDLQMCTTSCTKEIYMVNN